MGGTGWNNRPPNSGAPGAIRAPACCYRNELQINHRTSSGGRLDQPDPQWVQVGGDKTQGLPVLERCRKEPRVPRVDTRAVGARGALPSSQPRPTPAGGTHTAPPLLREAELFCRRKTRAPRSTAG